MHSGLIDQLPAEVGKHVPGIGFTSGCMIGEVPGDFRPHVKVEAKNETAREVRTVERLLDGLRLRGKRKMAIA
jgi:hypothetical protein